MKDYKKFNLEKALKGAKVVTRDGKKVTDIHLFDVKSKYCVYGVHDEIVQRYTKEGKLYEHKEYPEDLFMYPTKHIGYFVLWLDDSKSDVFETYEDAIKFTKNMEKYVDKIISFKWEL